MYQTIFLGFIIYLLSSCTNNNCTPIEFEDYFLMNDSLYSFELQRGHEEILSVKGDTETVRGFDSCAPEQTIYLFQRLRVSKDSTILNGFFKTFYSNGQLRSLSFYKWGKEDGFSKFFFSNGILSASGFFYNGQNIGTQEVFDSTGQPHLAYIPENDSEFWLQARYNNVGHIDSIIGYSFFVRAYIKPKMRAGEKFEDVLIEIPNLKRTSAVLNFSVHKNNEVLFDTSFFKFHKQYNSNFISLNYRFDSRAKGEYKVKLVGKLSDSFNHKVIKVDSSEYTIYVD